MEIDEVLMLWILWCIAVMLTIGALFIKAKSDNFFSDLDWGNYNKEQINSKSGRDS